MLVPLLLLLFLEAQTPATTASETDALYERAAALAGQGDVEQAAGLLERAVAAEAARGRERAGELARVRSALGQCHSALGHADAAIEQLTAAVELWRALGAHAETVAGLDLLGRIEYAHGRPEPARHHFEEAIEAAEVHGLLSAAPGIRSNLGMALQALGRDAQALEQYEAVLAQQEAAGDTRGAASTLGNVANLHLVAGRLADARAAYVRAQAAFERLGDTAALTATAVNLGMVLSSEGRLDEARAALEQAAERAGRERLPAMRASALLHLARVHESCGLYDKAEAAYKESLDAFRAADSPQNVAAGLNGLGSLYLAWGRGERTLAFADEALAIAERQKLADQIAASLELRGNAHRLAGRYNSAILEFQRVLDMARRLGREADRARAENEIGKAFLCWGRTSEAIGHFRDAMAIAERLGQQQAVAQAAIHLGAARHLAGDAPAARESYLRGLALSRAAGALPDQETVLGNLGVLALGLGDRREAEPYLLQAIELCERFRSTAGEDERPSALAPWLSAYRWLVRLHFLDGNASAVFDAGERMKARHLAERIAEPASTPGSAPGAVPIPAPGTTPTPEAGGIEAFRRQLAPRTAVVSFTNVDWRYPVAVVATRESIATYALEVGGRRPAGGDGAGEGRLTPGAMPRGSALGPLLAEYRGLLATPTASVAQRARRRALARQLYDVLLGPARRALAQADDLTILPDGALSLLPFETLLLPDGRFLVERHHVTYAPSLRVLRSLRSRRQLAHARSLLALGGTPAAAAGVTRTAEGAPTAEVPETQREALRAAARRRIASGRGAGEIYEALGYGRWAELPGARQEVEAIGRIVPGSLVLSGSEVSEARLKELSRSGELRQFRILHFATHGVRVPEAPELSALVLSEAIRGLPAGNGRSSSSDDDNVGPAEDGYLSAAEIARLDLQPDFVNLSACESGPGTVYGGEGAVGLTQAFLEAGAAAVSVSLWQVRDRFTRDFMVALYRRVQSEGVSHARAMTEVKRALIRAQKADPYLWAPFVYYGSD